MVLRKCCLLFMVCLLALASGSLLAGCGANAVPGRFVGRAARYDYSPSIIRTGNQLQIWWCGGAQNPEDPDQDSDTILYETINMQTQKKSDPVVVLAETPGSWDQVFTCNPRVIRGSFADPLGDGATYTYALYYVATMSATGIPNNIGVAFSNDGIHWNKYKKPVLYASGSAWYGLGQPALYNVDGKSRLVMFYEDIEEAVVHKEAVSSDGVHFADVGTLISKGLDANNTSLTWGDMGYDPVAHLWYAAFNLPCRSSASTGGQQERGQYGIQIYRIPDDALLSGTTPWQLMATFDTNSRTFESSFLAGFEKDQYGNLNVGAYPKITLYPSISTPSPHWDDSGASLSDAGSPLNWDIGDPIAWDPGIARLTLTRYRHETNYDTTTGALEPDSGLIKDAVIGHLLSGPLGAATMPFYNCKAGARDYFLSTDPLCGGAYIVGLEGYGYTSMSFAGQISGPASVAIYSCVSSNGGHFVSSSKTCGNRSGTGTLLGYALP